MTRPPSTEPSTNGMITARRRDSATKRSRVLTTLERMLADGEPVTAAALARRADVSTWLVYAPGIREVIDAARSRQQSQPPRPEPTAGEANLRTDLALARAEITRLRAEHDQHRQQLRLALGARLDNLAKADLVARLDELTAANTELAATGAHLRAENTALAARVAELEDDLAAARTSLRRMIRTENLPPDTTTTTTADTVTGTAPGRAPS